VTALVVSLGDVRVGLLHRRNEGSVFELDDDYLELANRPVLGQTFEDDPRRPYRTRQGIPSWFANLLPEGPLRALIAERAEVDQSRSFFLLRLLGDDLPGAVRVSPLDETDAKPTEQSRVQLSASTPTRLPLRFSLAGIQLKFSAIRSDRGLTIPAQGMGGDWIVKLPHQTYDGVPENEHLMMELARGSGLTVPETRLVEPQEIEGLPDNISLGGRLALAVRRFDRAAADRRTHIEDFAQVLGLSPRQKYKATSYDAIARVIAATCGPRDTNEFLRRLVFVVGIGNSDAHAKNWSLIYPDGRNAHLAPAYDIVAVSQFEAADSTLNRQLALKLGEARVAEEVKEQTFRRLAQRAGLSEEQTTNTVRDQVQLILAAWAERRESSAYQANPSLVGLLDRRFASLPLFAKT